IAAPVQCANEARVARASPLSDPAGVARGRGSARAAQAISAAVVSEMSPPATNVRPRLSLRERINAYERLLRLDKPIGVLLLLWPTLSALWIAAFGSPSWSLILVFV